MNSAGVRGGSVGVGGEGVGGSVLGAGLGFGLGAAPDGEDMLGAEVLMGRRWGGYDGAARGTSRGGWCGGERGGSDAGYALRGCRGLALVLMANLDVMRAVVVWRAPLMSFV